MNSHEVYKNVASVLSWINERVCEDHEGKISKMAND